MARYLVLNDSSVPRGDGVAFVRDGFHTFAFFVPLIWLLWHRLWLQAALVFAVMGLAAWGVSVLMPEALAVVTGLVFGMATAAETSADVLLAGATGAAAAAVSMMAGGGHG